MFHNLEWHFKSLHSYNILIFLLHLRCIFDLHFISKECLFPFFQHLGTFRQTLQTKFLSPFFIVVCRQKWKRDLGVLFYAAHCSSCFLNNVSKLKSSSAKCHEILRRVAYVIRADYSRLKVTCLLSVTHPNWRKSSFWPFSYTRNCTILDAPLIESGTEIVEEYNFHDGLNLLH